MTNYKKKLVIGTRSSRLALAQTKLFIDKLLLAYPDMSQESVEICPIKTTGDQNQSIRLDQMGGKGLFAKEIEVEILKGTIDLGIHSMKDMPVDENKDLTIACWLERFDYRDALLTNSLNQSFSTLRENTLIGTSSIRRRCQIINLRGDMKIKSLRGNVDTRIKKLEEKEFDAIVLSVAGLQRLSLDHLISYIFSDDEILPAASQGAVGIQIKSSNKDLKNFLEPLNHSLTETVCKIERDVLSTIGANCNSPIGVLAKEIDKSINLKCEIFDHLGKKIFSSKLKKTSSQAMSLGKKMGNNILSNLGQSVIDNLDNLKDDFDYTPKK
ncbi:MAG: hydroxymethylbilane synthase [Rhodobacteraceae bacterium]|nr:hydroxymethylbilane synthase [Paracoccaceae bacterium]|tara:strand:- start:4239 stop:5216 length:978 start_codon:yes stop_codon:yes gene_type:complete